MKLRAQAFYSVLLLALPACGSDDPEGEYPGGVARMSISALPYEAETGFELEEAWISLDRIQLVPCSANEGSISVSDFPVDLLYDPPPQAVFGTGLLNYCRVHLEARPSTSETPLDGLTALIQGTRDDGAAVVIESAASLDFDVVGSSFNVSQVVLGFDVARWLADVDLDGAELDDDGVALIDQQHNVELLASFETGLAGAVALYTDLDHDGLVGEDELMPIATPE